MFQFRRFPSYTYFIQYMMLHLQCNGLLHSDTCGSILACNSPQLFAAYRVLRRLPMPRHSPCALLSLTIFSNVLFLCSISHAFEVFYCSIFYLTTQHLSCCCRKIFYLHFLMHFYFALFSFQGSMQTDDKSSVPRITSSAKASDFASQNRNSLGLQRFQALL